MNKAEIISKHAQALKGQVGTSLAIDECEDIMASMMNEAINFIQCCTQLKDTEALTFDEFKDEFYYKAQMGIYEEKVSGMFCNLNDLNKKYQEYCLRF